MNKVPKAQPVKMATNVQARLAPMDKLNVPMAKVATVASPENQIGHKCQTLPRRSDNGI